jgi:RimJ/RimL family protein N-acetyltransferase
MSAGRRYYQGLAKKVKETMEIRLRPLTEEDVTEKYVSWLNDPEIRRLLGIRHKEESMTIPETLAFVHDCESQRRYHWGIFVDSKHVGNVSCSAWSENDKWIDVSYLVGDNSTQGKGVATLSVGAAMKYLFDEKGYNRIQAECAVENYSSLRVMEKLGMQKEGVLCQKLYLPDEDRFTDEIIYATTREKWKVPFAAIMNIAVLPMRWE